tara:strand:+ start:193 stop:477 length:285 start_codon:yes stop_codon:yes gene_type:complete
MAKPFKMKGHSLPGPNQKSPAKFLITGAMIAIAAAKAAAGTLASLAVNEGVKAAKKPGEKKKQKELESKEREALAKEKAANAMSGEIGSSSKIV